MKNPKLQSERWLKQAEYDLKQAQKSLEDQSYSYACFFAEQSSQKSVKAYLMFKGQRYINIHSVGELLKEASDLDKTFQSLIDSGKKIDRHYLASRYPDAVPEPAIPFESYVKDDAQEAVNIAREIFEMCKKRIEF